MAAIHVIIVTYNAMKWAERCFSSLRTSSVPVKCIVIDNGSTDGTQEYIKTYFPEVDFTQSPQNLGFGKANNTGIEKAYKEGADFFYLMNQDAWIYPDSFQKLLDVYNAYPDKNQLGILSPIHMDGSEKKLDIFFERYLARNTPDNRIFSDSFTNSLKDYYEIDFVNAAHWLLPKATIEEIGGFNPYFFHYSEDYEYVQRISFFGKKIIVCPPSRVVHDGKQDFHKTSHINALRVQREQRYLNPALAFDSKMLNRDFIPKMIKQALQLQFSAASDTLKEYQYQKDRFNEIINARNLIKNKGAAFLNI
ncbi:dTDP-Rha:alpha-D-GlcNAc-pyrophosphate polyprenol, alpha-3-L-rhamnosyltransferase [Chryseobacterium gleum]|uniref:dTDP-Rha:alpha-D-GlcNAc-pyrophosphate polyprenol, alpha-3-L-rhamnosyltransferase n=2 Tax=Chryseobacterium gleum TaxID=250 RepID=A0A3S4MEH7_CHRGE|nr:glycosyltransferase family 2 protein [Chryseobacterium gleum]EFK37857.1 glycosyltransferase, group 2 family protein [Chryseobacterium gleum ATCC 35910]QQY32679.1 glycosyltransferase family 2 protein [Chryseobacterium gleum]VEE10093.1 dTDP-Rha:alpha-D-GlcNAc-pyrophosphate polyprenol, alpha-3-L-rhamnosyltransferase [Chryseobacterium gleum]